MDPMPMLGKIKWDLTGSLNAGEYLITGEYESGLQFMYCVDYQGACSLSDDCDDVDDSNWLWPAPPTRLVNEARKLAKASLETELEEQQEELEREQWRAE